MNERKTEFTEGSFPLFNYIQGIVLMNGTDRIRIELLSQLQ